MGTKDVFHPQDPDMIKEIMDTHQCDNCTHATKTGVLLVGVIPQLDRSCSAPKYPKVTPHHQCDSPNPEEFTPRQK